MELIKVRRNFQLTIPRTLRKRLGLTVGDYVQADVEGGRIVIRPAEVVGSEEREGRRRSSKEQKAAYAALDEIWGKMDEENPNVIENTIKEAVEEARKQ